MEAVEKKLSFVEEYQCPGCVVGMDSSCFEPDLENGVGCANHVCGTIFSGIGHVFLGMPKGFNRRGFQDDLKINIFEKFSDGWGYTKFNVPVWRHLNKHGHTLVRGISPRINAPFLQIFLEDCMSEIDCLEITKDDINGMD